MSADVDYYDVQNMIRDARSEIRAEIADAVRAATSELRSELDELSREFHRVLDERTAHLV